MALKLDAGSRRRLEARFRWLSAEPPSFASAKKGLKNVAQSDRAGLGAFLVSLAGADGRLDPKEIAVLSKVYPLLGLEPQSVYSDIHKLVSSAERTEEGPVVVRPAGPVAGFAVPEPPGPEPARVVELDLDKVRLKLAETARVSKLLTSIFVDEEEPQAPPPVPLPPLQDDFAVRGLDAAHSALLLGLTASTTIDRGRFERMASRLGLLPDGALEAINEAAIEASGAPLVEGDETLQVDADILREMLG